MVVAFKMALIVSEGKFNLQTGESAVQSS
uniref:Uncharacterized protein n=1 Tax=Anguilla anguilla TaxID=7936 RepID=A0A0E9UY05_ANGAN